MHQLIVKNRAKSKQSLSPPKPNPPRVKIRQDRTQDYVPQAGHVPSAMMMKAGRLLDPKGRATVYKGFVRPVMEYAPLGWGSAAPTHLKLLDKLQNRAQKHIGEHLPLQGLGHRRNVAASSYLQKLRPTQKIFLQNSTNSFL